jgi:hypothetical protein
MVVDTPFDPSGNDEIARKSFIMLFPLVWVNLRSKQIPLNSRLHFPLRHGLLLVSLQLLTMMASTSVLLRLPVLHPIIKSQNSPIYVWTTPLRWRPPHLPEHRGLPVLQSGTSAQRAILRGYGLRQVPPHLLAPFSINSCYYLMRLPTDYCLLLSDDFESSIAACYYFMRLPNDSACYYLMRLPTDYCLLLTDGFDLFLARV